MSRCDVDHPRSRLDALKNFLFCKGPHRKTGNIMRAKVRQNRDKHGQLEVFAGLEAGFALR
jgi:hypothetical protein